MVTALDPTDAVHPECMGELNGGLFSLPSMIMACVLVIFTVWGWLSYAPELAFCCSRKESSVDGRIHISYKFQRFFLGVLTLSYPMVCRIALTHVSCATVACSHLCHSREERTVRRRKEPCTCYDLDRA